MVAKKERRKLYSGYFLNGLLKGLNFKKVLNFKTVEGK